MNCTDKLSWPEVKKELPVLGRYDVVVCGAGAAGIPAALAARRESLRVLLVEARAQLGGTGTSGLVSHWLGGRTEGGRTWVVGGLFRALAEEAERLGIARLPLSEDYPTPYQPFGWFRGLLNGVPFEPFAMAAFLDRKMAEAGVDVLLDTQAVDPVVAGDRITHVVLSNKDGLTAVEGRAFIDATGDADLAARSGCTVVNGREEDGLTAPATLEFLLENVDETALSAYINDKHAPRFREEIKQLRDAGIWTFPYDILISVEMDRPGTMMINTPRLCDVKGTDAQSVSEALQRGRAEILALTAILRDHFPGFGDARIKAVAPMLGIRETRRIVGRAVLRVDDVVSGRVFDDVIGYSAYGWDLPDPKRPSLQPMTEKAVKVPKWIPIPYAILVPKPIVNLLCPGRAVSVERDVLGPLRVMAPCMAQGEAAGCAAALAGNGSFADVDVGALQRKLRACGAILDAPGAEMATAR